MTRALAVSFTLVLSLSAGALAQNVPTPQPEIRGVIAAGTTVQLIKAFGGTDRRTLYITGRDSLFSVKMLSQGPPDRAK